MSVVGQIAKNIFTSYGEMLTQTGKFLRDNRKKILGWTVGTAVAVIAAAFGGTPVVVAEIGAAMVAGGFFRLFTSKNEMRKSLAGACLVAIGAEMVFVPLMISSRELVHGQPMRGEYLQSDAAAVVRKQIQSGAEAFAHDQRGTDYFKFGHFAPVELLVVIKGKAECRDARNTNLYLKINGEPEFYTRPDPKSAWKNVGVADFNFKLACGGSGS